MNTFLYENFFLYVNACIDHSKIYVMLEWHIVYSAYAFEYG